MEYVHKISPEQTVHLYKRLLYSHEVSKRTQLTHLLNALCTANYNNFIYNGSC